jgi:hypothetical protein
VSPRRGKEEVTYTPKKETQLGKFELSLVKKEGLNSKSLKIFDARVKPRHLRHVKEQWLTRRAELEGLTYLTSGRILRSTVSCSKLGQFVH